MPSLNPDFNKSDHGLWKASMALSLPCSSCPGKLKKASFQLKSSHCWGSSWSWGIKKARELKKWASGQTSRKVRDGPATDSCNSPALPLLQIYFFWPGCPARVQLPLHPALGPSAPSLASQLYSCAQHCQAAFLRLSVTLLPLAMQHLMNPHEDRLSAPQNYSNTRGHNLGGSLLACVSQAFLSWSADAAFTHAVPWFWFSHLLGSCCYNVHHIVQHPLFPRCWPQVFAHKPFAWQRFSSLQSPVLAPCPVYRRQQNYVWEDSQH